MKYDVPAKVLEIIEKFEKKDFEIYIVGGAVRDILMKKPVYDCDFTTNAHPTEMLELVDTAYYTNDFGMVGIPAEVEDERPYEITTFRTESGYSDARRPDKVEWGKTLTEDLKRRDFTINAMALKVISNKEKVTRKENNLSLVTCHSLIFTKEKETLIINLFALSEIRVKDSQKTHLG